MKILDLVKVMGSANVLFGFVLFFLMGHAWQAHLTDALLASVLLSWSGFTVLGFAWVARGRLQVRLVEAEIDAPAKRNN